MNSRPRKRHSKLPGLRFWHRWLGLTSALVLVIAAISGALLVYQKPLVRILVADGAELPGDYGFERILPELDAIARRISPADDVLIKAPNPEEPYWTLRTRHGGYHLLRIDDLTPYSDTWGVLAFFAFTRELHTEMLAGEAGEWLYLVGGAIGLLLVISGVYFWWPARRMFRWRLVVPKQIRPGLLLQYHRHAGALFSPVLILVTFTGCIMLWQKLIAPLMPPVPTTTWKPGGAAVASAEEVTPSRYLARAAEQIPDGWPSYIRLPSQLRDQYSFRFTLPGEWHPNGRTSVTFDPASGDMTVSARSDSVGPVRRLLNQLYPLHSGYGLHYLYSLALLLAGGYLVWLSVTGVLNYLLKRKRLSTAQCR